MKKFLVIIIALTALLSCQKKENPIHSDNLSTVTHENVENSPVTSAQTVTENTLTSATTLSRNTENISGTSVTTVTTVSTTFNTVSTVVTQDSSQQPDPLGGGAFSYDEDGAVQFEQVPDAENDKLMISAGQALFESACNTQWNFTVGCPYNLDMNATVQNGFGWTYYKITDDNIKSISDVENDYYKVFSERYPNEDLKMLYLEFDGEVYALNGQREMNIYYSVSRIKNIKSRTDDEIFFTVESLFEGTDKNPEEDYSEEDTFSVVISPDGKWKAGQFRLPY